MNVRPLFIADAQPPELIQPSESSLHYPAPTTQAATVLRVALCQEGSDATGAQTSPDRLGVIGAIAQEAVGTTARMSTHALQSAASSLDVALLSSYRLARRRHGGLFLRFGALNAASLRTGVTALVAAESKVER